MSGFARVKRVTDPLDANAKARLVGGLLSYVSSGSEHSADDSPCLSELVHGFLEEEEEDDLEATRSQGGYESDSDRVNSVSDCTDLVEDIMRSSTVNSMDSYRNLLFTHVLKAMEVFSRVRHERGLFRRQVMMFLRKLGHNAAICNTKWESSGGLTAGNYEFIDVVHSTTSATRQNRYIIDLDFASQFEIARPTRQYSNLLQHLPKVFVCKMEDLKRIVKVMCDAAKRSLKSRELTLPPWRKNRYMQNKWTGPHLRTVNPVAASSRTPILNNGVKCRCVGFDDAVNGSFFVR